jgi:hypothetical protein
MTRTALLLYRDGSIKPTARVLSPSHGPSYVEYRMSSRALRDWVNEDTPPDNLPAHEELFFRKIGESYTYDVFAEV